MLANYNRIYSNLLYFLFVLLFFKPLKSQPQEKKYYEVSVLAGTSWFVGDLNPYAIPYPNFLSPYVGVSVKRVYNRRWTVFISSGYTQLRSSDKYQLYKFFRDRGFYFLANVGEVILGAEFNYHYFTPLDPKVKSTPFLHAGLGACYFNHLKSYIELPNSAPTVILAFGPGFKALISQKTSLICYFTLTKTFSDRVDNVTKKTKIEMDTYYASQSDFTNKVFKYVGNNTNPDWYFVIKIGLSFFFGSVFSECPGPSK